MDEKKEIKISLGTFTVIVISITVLILALILCLVYFFVIKPTPTTNGNSQLSKASEASNSTSVSNKSININTTNNSKSSGENTNTVADSSSTPPESETKIKAEDNAKKSEYILYKPSYNVSFKDIDLDQNLSLETKIRTDLTVNQVSNYASTMKWSNIQNSLIKVPYPTDWNVEKQTNGIESYRITGKAIGKEASKEEYGTNTNRVVEKDVIIVIYEPIICDVETKTSFEKALLSGYDTNSGIHWHQLFIENAKVSVTDNYAFFDNEDGTCSLQKVRFIYQKSNIETYKTLNIENYLIGEITKVK